MDPVIGKPRSGVTKDNTVLYRASKADCTACPLKPTCCPNTPIRKVPRSIHEGARDMARDIGKTDAYVVSRRQCKKSGCCSPISNASSGWIGCDYEDPAVPATSSTGPPPPRTCESSPS